MKNITILHLNFGTLFESGQVILFYFLKCANAAPNKLFVGVGDPNAHHKCWERHEDMDIVRSVYYVSPSNPGSDVAGEMAVASLVFRSVDPVYSKKLLGNAVKVFRFAVQYKGSYSDSLGSAALVAITTKSGRR
ncbi:hypothetical protein KY284_033298 [Solanum tuberosum]|nr:hypothetical protein KY284_033298 [Solanum tuberosum]